VFFSTSNAGGAAPAMAKNETTLRDAQRHRGAQALRHHHHLPGRRLHQGSLPKLRASGWKGHWIDAASTLRMENDAVIILDPVNMPVIKRAGHGRQELDRRQLHRELHADGRGRPVQGRPGGVDVTP
jgi:aspartate-semialdehyde dehydrogenase